MNYKIENIRNLFSKFFSASVCLIFFLIFLEDFIRMNLGSIGVFTYILKDIIILFLYILFISLIFNYSNLLNITENVRNILFYIVVLSLFYICSSLINFNNLELIFLGIRVDLFYWLIGIAIIIAYENEKFYKNFCNILLLFLFVNVFISLTQLMFPEFLKNIPGFYGIYEINKVERIATFHKTEWNYLYGIFTDVGKLNSNLYNIFIWLLIFFLSFKKIKFSTLSFSIILILIVLFFSGKRIYFIFCSFFLILISFYVYFLKKKIKEKNDYIFLNSLFKKIFISVGCLFLLTIFLFIIKFENVAFYYNYIEYSITNQISERFFDASKNFGFVHELNNLKQTNSLLYGKGIGLSTSGNQYILDPKTISSGYEYGPLKLIYELGILGILQFILFWFIIFMIDFRSIYNIKMPIRIRLGVIVISYYHLSFFITFLLGHQYWDDAQNQIHFWAITGTQIFIFNNFYYKKNARSEILI